MEPVGEYVGALHPAMADRASILEPAPQGIRIKKFIFNVCAGGLVLLICWGLSALFHWHWLLWTGYALCGTVAVMGGYAGLTAMLAPCPYCKKPVGTTGEIDLSVSDENVKVQCDACQEILISDKGELRAFADADARSGQTFDAPLFLGGVWPAECIVCGRPSTRTEEARKSTVELTKLIAGRLSVERSTVSQIPYCADHGGAVSATKKSEQLRVVFIDYAAQRRYLAANAGKIAVK